MARQVTATLSIGFGNVTSESDGADTLIAEIDTRVDGLNKGKRSFLPGDDVFILVYRGSNVTIDDAIISLGSINYRPGNSPQIVELEEDIVFANESDASLTRPILSIQSDQWLGTDLGNVVKTGELQVSLSNPPVNNYAGVNRVGYTANADVYQLSGTLLNGTSEYEIVVVFIGTAV